MKILRAASLGSIFTISYKKSVVLQKEKATTKFTGKNIPMSIHKHGKLHAFFIKSRYFLKNIN